MSTQAISGYFPFDSSNFQPINTVAGLKTAVVARSTKLTIKLQYDISTYTPDPSTPLSTIAAALVGADAVPEYASLDMSSQQQEYSLGFLLASDGVITFTTTSVDSYSRGDTMRLVVSSRTFFNNEVPVPGTLTLATATIKSRETAKRGYFSPSS